MGCQWRLAGRFFKSLAALEYMLFENFGVGLGYNLFYIDVEVDGSKFLGEVDYKFQGVNVFGVLRF